MSALPRCNGNKADGARCGKNVSRDDQEFCPIHGGLTKDGNLRAKKFTHTAKLTCSGKTAKGLPCKRAVTTARPICSMHKPKKDGDVSSSEMSKPKGLDKFRTPRNFVDDVHEIMCRIFADGAELEAIRVIAQHWLEFAESKRTDEDWCRWFIGGRSNESGNSFGEVYKIDPFAVIVRNPHMPRKTSIMLTAKFRAMSEINGAVKYYYDSYAQNYLK